MAVLLARYAFGEIDVFETLVIRKINWPNLNPAYYHFYIEQVLLSPNTYVVG